ncbi:MAG: COG1615 family transporter, partial [Gemmatimonadales bacterium]|nr:COG1615 family transporter [Gemmatimonadales bacterium]
PLWRTLHGFSLLLAILGLLVVLILYVVVGSVRWLHGRPAISDHARRHLGLLLVAVALCLAWGYLLEPFELVGGIKRLDDAGTWGVRQSGAQLLTGVALGAGAASALWAWRPRHALLVAVWAILVVTSLAVHLVAPGISRKGEPVVPEQVAKELEAVAFALSGLEFETEPAPDFLFPDRPPLASWDRRSIALLASETDSQRLVAVSPATVSLSGTRRPVWLMVREDSAGGLLLSSIAADRATATGSAMAYRLGDTLAYPSLTTMLDLPPGALHPLARHYHVDSLETGFRMDSRFRRIMLAWGLQVGSFLRGLPPNTTLTWNLVPGTRLRRLAPFAEWDTPAPRVVDGDLVWVATGYVRSESFPLVRPEAWRGSDVRMMAGGFLGTVHSATGETHVYQRDPSDPITSAWADLARGVVEPPNAIPERIARLVPYPIELFRIQSRVLQRPRWGLGRLEQTRSRLPGAGFDPSVTWQRLTDEPTMTAVYAEPGNRMVSAVLVASREGRDVLRIARLDSSTGVPVPAVVQGRWERFPLYEQIRDSVLADGAEFAAGPVRYGLIPGGGGVLATQAYFGRRGASGRPQLAWMAVGARGRLGAGRNPVEAWTNLLGESAPEPPGSAPLTRFEEARRWMMRADSALRAGRWEEFGRAFESLRRVFGVRSDSGG